jgi:uncharacterized protein YacL (UPF0231 family)
LARQFIIKVRVAHRKSKALVNTFADEIGERNARHPERGIRADHLKSISRRWQAAGDQYRLAFDDNLVRTKGSLCEVRLGYSKLVHPEWDEPEQNLAILFVSLSVTRKRAQVTVRCEHVFSHHAVARWFERSRKRSDTDLISAMTRALVILPADLELGEDVHVSGWRGSIITRQKKDETRNPIWAARTWWGEDDG